MSSILEFRQKPPQVFKFPSWDRVLIYLCALFIVCWSVGPFLWQMSTSIQPDRELMRPTPHFFPDPITFEHFVNFFVGKSFQRYVINSAIVTITTTLICLLFGSIAAFALARLDIRGRFGILGFILGVSMFPQIAIVAPLYVLASNFGWLDTYRILILIYLALGLPPVCHVP